jgi:hypothetical protein
MVIALNLSLVSGMRMASDALFLEGVPLSIVGALLVLGKGIIKNPFHIKWNVSGVRILTIGVMLVLSSIAIGEILRLL